MKVSYRNVFLIYLEMPGIKIMSSAHKANAEAIRKTNECAPTLLLIVKCCMKLMSTGVIKHSGPEGLHYLM